MTKNMTLKELRPSLPKVIEEIDHIIGITTETKDVLVSRLGRMHDEGEMKKDIFEFFISMINRRSEMTMMISQMDDKSNAKKFVRIKSSIRKKKNYSDNKKRVRFL